MIRIATIKDIAKAAGVSHATVSNVLNQKGIVSAEKVKLVQDAARAIGYRVNEAASALRSGKARVLAVILPDMHSAAHCDLFMSLCHAASARDVSVMLRVTGNVPARERRAIHDAASARAGYAVAVTSLPDAKARYEPLAQSGTRVLFALRSAQEDAPFIGFDLRRAAADIAARARADGAARVGLMTNMATYPAERAFREAFLEAARGVPVQAVQSVAAQYAKQAFDFFDGSAPDAVVTTCEEMALAVLSVAECLGVAAPRLYTLAASRTFPSSAYAGYGLDYRALGSLIGEKLLQPAEIGRVILPADGFCAPPRAAAPGRRPLRLLSIDNPCTEALRRLRPRLLKETGIDLSIETRPTAGVTRAFDMPGGPSGFDLARMDIGLVDCHAEALFEPVSVPATVLPALVREYAAVRSDVRALPFDPSCQMLFYRQDLFENPRFQRAFFERHKSPLEVPKTFEAYARAAAFFDGCADETNARGALVTGQSSECLSFFVARSPDGSFPPPTAEAVEAFVDTRRRLEAASPAAKDESWNSIADRFARGESAMLITHANYAERFAHDPLARAAGRIGFAPAPGERSLLGGGVLGVLRGTENRGQAFDFLSWLYSEKTAAYMALLGGCSPCGAPYENAEVLDIFPWLPEVRAGLARGVRRGVFPRAPYPFHQLRLEQRIARACMGAVRGALTPAQAVRAIQAAYPAE